MNEIEDDDFALEIERLVEETCAAIDSAYMSEEFLTAANESFNRIPIFKTLQEQAEKDGNTTNPA